MLRPCVCVIFLSIWIVMLQLCYETASWIMSDYGIKLTCNSIIDKGKYNKPCISIWNLVSCWSLIFWHAYSLSARGSRVVTHPVCATNSDRRPDWSVLITGISCRPRLCIPNYASQWEDKIIKVPPYYCVGKSHLFILRFSTTILRLNLYKCLRH